MYANVVEKVREAFEVEQVVKLCYAHVGMSDSKRIAVKLRVCILCFLICDRKFPSLLCLFFFNEILLTQDMVPCVPILYKDEQIILWSGKKATENTLNDL